MDFNRYNLFDISCLIILFNCRCNYFSFQFGKKGTEKSCQKNNLKNNLEKYKIDLCWWDNLPFKKVSVLSFDNLKLVGHYLDLKSDRTVILVHGYSANYKEMQQYAKFFHQKTSIFCA